MTEQTPAWLQVSLIINGELAEAVADALSRYAPNGVIIESIAIIDEEDGPGYPTDEVKVYAYLPMDDRLEEKRQQIEQALAYLSMIEPLPPAQFTPIAEENWMENWKQHFKPIAVGEKLLITPAWLEVDDADRIPIKIDVGMAFGTGTHPTTQLSLALLEKHTRPNQPVLDIGCGSGILAVGAVKLGASQAYGVDVDQKSILNANTNADLNEVTAKTKFEIGSVDTIQESIFPIQQAPVVVANILAHILLRLMDNGMGDLVNPNGILLLSGILAEKESTMLASLEKHGFHIIERLQMGDWLGLAAKRITED